MITIEYFHTNIGQRAQVQVERPEDIMAMNIEMGSKGWTPVMSPPPGGFRFGLEAEKNFNWKVVGGHRMVKADGTEGVMWRGDFYAKRTFEEVNTKKMQMPEAVKYSRGARATDPVEMREKGDGDIEYVSLAMFRGRARIDPGTQLSAEQAKQQEARLEEERKKSTAR